MHTWIKCALSASVGMLAACELSRDESSVETPGTPIVSPETQPTGTQPREEATRVEPPIADISETCTENSFGKRYCEVFIDGEIRPGLLSKLSKQIMDVTISGALVTRVNISSPGGDVSESIRIGRYLRSLELSVLVGAKSSCYSSCVLILAGGAKRFVLGDLGIHRPYFVSGAASTEDARTEFMRLRDEVTQFLQDGGVSPKLWDDMLIVPPERIRLLSSSEQDAYGISGSDPSFVEKQARENMDRYGINRAELNRRIVEGEMICREKHPDDMANRALCKVKYNETGGTAD